MSNLILSNLLNKDKVCETQTIIQKLYKLEVFVYSGGKTGGSTLNRTFNNNNFTTIHVHSNYYFQKVLIKNDDITIFNVIDYSKKKRPIVIIDSYRTPIERKISSFFENISEHLPNYSELSVEQLILIFNEKFLYGLEEYHPMDDLTNHYGFPNFKTFNFTKKYNKCTFDNITFVKIRFNEIDRWHEILSEIFGQKITMFNENLTANKKIIDLYNEFKNKYKIPDKYLDENIVNDTNFYIYNSIDEQIEYLNKWNKKRISLHKIEQTQLNSIHNNTLYSIQQMSLEESSLQIKELNVKKKLMLLNILQKN